MSTSVNPETAAANSTRVVDVYSASAYGDLEKLRVFVEQDKHSVSEPNDAGHYALQWACLRDHADVAKYVVEHGGEVDAVDCMQQTALHWAAAQGSVAAAEVLLQNGASVEAADVHGYRAAHFAAQYGQTRFLNYIVFKYGADLDALDNDGKSPLHWAASKEFADTVRLLVFRDAFLGRQDNEGRTPLHWAAIRGNAEICTILVHAGAKEELLVKDSSGLTPSQLAADKDRQHVSYLLSNAMEAHGRCWENNFSLGRMKRIGYAPVLLVLIVVLMVLFINSVLSAPNLPKVTAVVGLWTCAGFSLAFGSLLMFYRCSSKDPGYTKSRTRHSPRGADVEDTLLNIDLDNSSIWTGNWHQLCSTCKIIRPVRSKHCTTCNRCVELFDHHCPWISNCVGKGNKRDFYILACMGTLTLFMGAVITFQRLWTVFQEPLFSKSWFHQVIAENPGAFAFLVMDVALLSGTTTLTIAQTAQIAQNITTNELVNASRYVYLRGPEGRYRNPFSRGFRKNCSDFFIYGHGNDIEVARTSL